MESWVEHNNLTIISYALNAFRRQYGINANPEDMPEEWRAVVLQVREELAEKDYQDEGGEG